MKKLLSTFAALLLIISAYSQTFVFTQSTKETKVLTAAANNGIYTFMYDFTAGYDFNKVQGATVWWRYGDNFVYSSWYDLTWVTTYIDMSGNKVEDKTTFHLADTWGMEKLSDNKQHKMTFVRSINSKALYIDSVFIAQLPTKPQNSFSADIYMSTDRADMKLCGTVTGIRFTPTITAVNYVTMPAGVVDTNQYPLNYVLWSNNYSNVPTPVQQYQNYKVPKFDKKSTIERNHLCIELKYMSGYMSQPTALLLADIKSGSDSKLTPREQELKYITNSIADPANQYEAISANGRYLAKKLAEEDNCGFRIMSNINSGYSDITRGYYSFDTVMMGVAKNYPHIRKDFGSAMVQTSNIPPYIAAELDQTTINTPVAAFSGTRNIVYLQGLLLKNTLASFGIADTGMNMFEDMEGMSSLGGGVAGTSAFVRNYNYMLDSMRSLFPRLYSTGYNLYSYHWESSAVLFPQVLGVGNSQYSTESMYLETPDSWCNLNGTEKGWPAICRLKYDQIQKGYKFSTPFVSPGWNSQIEKNMQPAQFSGMVGIELVMGAKWFYPSYFTTGGNVQNPAGYCYIPRLIALVQASVSNPTYWKIIERGDLLAGTSAAIVPWDYNQWSGKWNVITVARKLGTEYLIATTRQKGNIYKTQHKTYINPVIDGMSTDSWGMFATNRICIWYVDVSKPIIVGTNPKLLTKGVPHAHLSRINPLSNDSFED